MSEDEFYEELYKIPTNALRDSLVGYSKGFDSLWKGANGRSYYENKDRCLNTWKDILVLAAEVIYK